jgi:hypothetical protein
LERFTYPLELLESKTLPPLENLDFELFGLKGTPAYKTRDSVDPFYSRTISFGRSS